jgi:hypothetical protein
MRLGALALAAYLLLAALAYAWMATTYLPPNCETALVGVSCP